MEEMLVLVDERDRMVGSAGKMWVHREGRLHRAFSIFIYNPDGSMLLQQRADGKYHSAGLWSNTCCGHPRPGETLIAAARRRLAEEMGIQCRLRRVFSFVYREQVTAGLIEHEFDHVFIGVFDGDPTPSAAEVRDWRWIRPEQLNQALEQRPETFTIWFRRVVEMADGRSWPSGKRK